MDLKSLMQDFQNIGFVSIGKGPQHPEGDPEIEAGIQDFLEQYPSIAEDDTFVEFLLHFSAAAVDWPDEQLTIEIYGFSPDITLEIANPEEPLLDNDGFFRFAEILVKPGPEDEKAIDSLYAFDTTGTRKKGIYHKISLWSEDTHRIEFRWCCESFLEWLSMTVDAKGRLPMEMHKT